MHARDSFCRRLPRGMARVMLALLTLTAAAPGVAAGPVTPAAIEPLHLVVNSLADSDDPPRGRVTLRSAIRRIRAGGRITFSPALNGRTIGLTIIGDAHTILKAETFDKGKFIGYFERDYGASALYARKNLTIDASALPKGITLSWAGGDDQPARVLAVYGDVTLVNVTLRDGFARHEAIPDPLQPYTLARGGGLAVWGTATLTKVTVGQNRVEGDPNASRDRGAFGGGIYANRLVLRQSTVAGNRARGYGAAGGGVYSVGGAEGGVESRIERSAITGNRVTAEHAYGGGVYSDGGGPGNRRTITIVSSTLAFNLVEDHPDIGEPDGSQYYYRGGGFYMSNGTVALDQCTVAGNVVSGLPATFNGRPNMGGGGMAATIGNAHVVEQMRLAGSIVAGNTVNGQPGDVYSGSLIDFLSLGYNRIGHLDMSQMLVPIPPWWSIDRNHWPAAGDSAGADAATVLDAGRTKRHPTLVSAGADEGQAAALWIPPAGAAVNQIPTRSRVVTWQMAEFDGPEGLHGTFLNDVLQRMREVYADVLGDDFGTSFGDQSALQFYEVPVTWPGDARNAPWIAFWRSLDAAIAGRLGPAGLADSFWGAFEAISPGYRIDHGQGTLTVTLPRLDQRGAARPRGARADIGAVER